MSQSGRPPRRRHVTAAIILVGLAICIAVGVISVFSLNRQIQGFQRLPVPGHGDVTFTHAGSYIMFIERPGQCCSVNLGGGSSDSGSSAPVFANWSMNLALVPAAANGGRQVTLRSWQGAPESYAVTGHQGMAAISFTIDKPGRYVLTASAVSPRSIADIAVGQSIGPAFAAVFLWPSLCLVVVILLAIVVAVFRRRRRRQFAAGQFAWPGPAPQPWSPAGRNDAPPPPRWDDQQRL